MFKPSNAQTNIKSELTDKIKQINNGTKPLPKIINF
jgi:hypothetical protein